MTTRRSPSRFVLLAPWLLALACGGGGGSADPDLPERPPVASHAIAGQALDVELAGTTAYVSISILGMEPTGKVRAVAVSDPLAPAARGEIDLGGFVGGLGFSGGKLFAVHDVGWSGKRLSEIDPETMATTGRGLDLDGGYGDLATAAGRAFLAVSDTPGGMLVVDLATLAVTAEYDGAPGSFRVFVAGNRAYLSGQTLALDVVDITTIASPQKVGALANTIDDGSPAGLAVTATAAGTRAALGCGALGVAEVSLVDEAHPAFLGFHETGGFAGTIAFAGELALVAVGGSGVLVIDFSDPLAPVARARLRSTGYASDVVVSGRYAYAIGAIFPSGPAPGPPSSSALDVFDLAEWQ